MGTALDEKPTIEQAAELALSLTPHEQAVLLTRLHENLESIETGYSDEADWHREIERRLHEVENGEVELMDHEDVMKQLRERFA